MKKLFVLAIAAGLFAACNNASTPSGDTTHVDTNAVAAPSEPVAAPVDTNAVVGDTTGVDTTAHH